LDEDQLVVSFIKAREESRFHHEKQLDTSVNNNIVLESLKKLIDNPPSIIYTKHNNFYLENELVPKEKIAHVSFKSEGIQRISFKFVEHYSMTNPFFKRQQRNTMDIHAIGEFTNHSIQDYQASIIEMFQRIYPPRFSSYWNIEDIDISKGAVHGMSHALKQRSIYDTPEKIERENGIQHLSESDMLSIPEVKTMYAIKSYKAWIYQDHNYSHSNMFKKYTLSGMFEWGRLDLKFYCDSHGTIKHVDCFSDAHYRNLHDVLHPIFLNMELNDKAQLIDSFEMYLCHEIIEDTGAIFIINDIKDWLHNVDFNSIKED
jgi:hypothetical protein